MNSPKHGADTNSPRWSGGRVCGFLLVFAAAGLLLVSLKLPLWQMHLEAPQYRGTEALNIAVHPNAIRGDIRELAVLDQYIGVHIPPTLPQFKWLPGVLVSGAILGILTFLLGDAVRRMALIVVVAGLAAALGFAAVQAKWQIHDIGHRRDQKTILVGVKDFTPPFIGTSKIAQFQVSSRFGLGAFLIGAALMVQLGAAQMGRRAKATTAAGVARLDLCPQAKSIHFTPVVTRSNS